MKKLLTTACLFVVTTIVFVSFIAPFVSAQQAKQPDREARKTYPDFALQAPPINTSPREYKDVVYATVGGKDLRLDLYMPAGVQAPPLLIWVHGGAWRAGTKAQVPTQFVDHGIATASLDFRQSTDARFPAMVHDIKAAIRFLRAKAVEYRYRTDRIAIGGGSSGGHLAALVGVTNGDQQLEGTVGNYLNQSSSVQAIVVYFGASNLMTILAQSTPFGLNIRRPALELLLGALPENARELAELASPVVHVDRHDPPLLLLHGDQDLQMPINQAHELQGAYEKLGLDVYFDVVHGAAHGGDLFFSPEHFESVLAFLHRTIGRQNRTSTANSDLLAVQRAAAAFIEAFNNLDWERFRHSFSDDATTFFPSRSGESPRRANGRDEIEARFKPGFDAIRKSKPNPPYLNIEPKDLKIQMLRDGAIVTFHLGGDDSVGRRTVVFQKRKGKWLIVHLHASVIAKPK